MNRYSIARDRNGNKVLRVKPPKGRGFSIQTNGNLPMTHVCGIGSWTQPGVLHWVTKHGTPRQKRVMGLE